MPIFYKIEIHRARDKEACVSYFWLKGITREVASFLIPRLLILLRLGGVPTFQDKKKSMAKSVDVSLMFTKNGINPIAKSARDNRSGRS